MRTSSFAPHSVDARRVSQRIKLARAVLLFGLVSCCTQRALADEFIAHSDHAVLNGDDNRRELYALTSPALRARVVNDTAAVMWAHRLRRDALGIQLRAEPLGEHFGLCAGESYARQPSAASCSATLVDDDLVLTAGHCLGGDEEEARERCPRLRFVFEYEIDAGDHDTPSVMPGHVYSCRAVAAFGKSTARATFLDFAFVQLDRPATGRNPATISQDPPHAEQPVSFASHGAGLPIKVEESARIVSAPLESNHFVAATDSFAGGSGGSVYDAELELIGYAVRGAGDWITDGACLRAAHSSDPSEQYQRAAVVLSELCKRGWPSARLCATPSVCGDGICSVSESPSSCSTDCAPPRCGDKICDFDEDGTCETDCPRFVDVPPSWDLDPATYRPDPRARAAGCSLAGATGSAKPSWLFASVLAWVCRRRRRGAARGEYWFHVGSSSRARRPGRWTFCECGG